MSYRVLHVLDHSWPVLSGYSVRSRYLVTAEHQIGMQPQVLTGPLHELDDPAACETSVDNVTYSRTPFGGRFSRALVVARWPIVREAAVVFLLRQRILRLLDTSSVDVIHAHSPALCGLAAWQASQSRNTAFVYEVRAFWEDAAVDQNRIRHDSAVYRFSRGLESFVSRRADAVVGIAKPMLDDLRARGVNTEKLFHVPNGVDAETFCSRTRDTELAAKLKLGSDPVLGFIGTMYRYEGISWLVRAVTELRRRGTLCQLLIAGNGEDFSEVVTAVKQAGAEDYIRVLGTIPHDLVQRYYSLMDVMVYPRHSVRLTELVTPLKPLEALALGKAVLASNVGGIRELVNPEETALLFQPDDIEDFCQQAQRLLKDETLRARLGKRAQQMILRDKDWKILARRYEEVYEAAIRNKKRLHSN